MRRRCKVKTEWNANLAYAIGIITSDGNLSCDGRHINITSKDYEMAETFKSILCLDNKIGKKARGGTREKKYFVLQFGDINFYEFLLSIGLTAAKSKTLRQVQVPREFFADFLRGCIDGDGTIGAFKHPESRWPQIRLRLASASPLFLNYMLASVREIVGVTGGHIYQQEKKGVGLLSFATADSIKILKFMYYDSSLPALTRKRMLAEGFLRASGATG